LSNIVSETGSTGFVEGLARLQAEAAGDNFFLDLGGAAEDLVDAAADGMVVQLDIAHGTVGATRRCSASAATAS
jgi:hypothetical protein